MHRVVLNHLSAADALSLKEKLDKSGLIIGHDYEWAYYQAKYDNDGFSAVQPKHAVFSFREGSIATFFKLKWT
jgi:hypothetical protein